MKAILRFTLMTFLLSLSMFTCTAYAHKLSPTEESQKTLESINKERSSAGMCPLCGEEHLGCCACARANEVCTHFSHTRPDGTPYYTVDPDCVYGEILGAGADSTDEVMNEWMNSEAHREEILNPNYNDAGVTVLDKNGKRYWVVEFGY